MIGYFTQKTIKKVIELTDCEIDEIVEGTVVEIRDIGAFVELPNKIRGLVHISEVSDDYVVNVSDYLSVGIFN